MYENYAKLRDSKGMSDYEVSKLAGIPASSIYDWKSGRSKPKADKLSKIAKTLNCSIEDLI